MNLFFRIEEILDYWDYLFNYPKVSLRIRKFKLLKPTPKGFWITPFSGNDENFNFQPVKDPKHWISQKSRKKYAYPTKLEAINGFIKRKERQITILSRKLEIAKAALDIGKSLLEEESINEKTWKEKDQIYYSKSRKRETSS